MSTHSTDHSENTAGEHEHRYAELDIGKNEFVIYDRENHKAWLQSSVAVSLDEFC